MTDQSFEARAGLDSGTSSYRSVGVETSPICPASECKIRGGAASNQEKRPFGAPASVAAIALGHIFSGFH